MSDETSNSIMSDESSNFIKVGPVLDKDADHWDEKGHDKILQIFLSHGTSGINSIQFQYYDSEKRNIVLSDKHGTDGCSKYDVVRLDCPNEYITRISGLYNGGSIKSITFGTNKGEHGPFGEVKNEYENFRYEVGNGQFGGFYGSNDRKSGGVASIGVYLIPIVPKVCHRNLTFEESMIDQYELDNIY